MSSSSSSSKMDIDEGLYSRQLYVMGHEAQRSLGMASVLICGLDGIGVEIAKNVILAGPKSVTLLDDTKCSLRDMSSQYYINEQSIKAGKTRAEASITELANLNPYVNVSIATKGGMEGLLKDPEFIGSFSVLVMNYGSYATKIMVNNLCRSRNVKFIACGSRGLAVWGFCDFGDEFTVLDSNGEAPISRIVASVSQENPGLVTVHDETMHGLQDGDYVTFSEVIGMEQLNHSPPRQIRVKGPFTFEIEDTSKYGAYVRGGYVSEVKMPKKLGFKSLQESLQNPGEFLITDFAKIGRAELLHEAFQSLDNNNKIESLEQIRSQMKKPDPSWFTDKTCVTALTALIRTPKDACLAPLAAFIGGVLGQEVLKAVTGKFTPLHQWVYYDAFESLQEGKGILSNNHFIPTETRYFDQVSIFGQEFVDRLQSAKLFLVGSGAIGCEMLKNWAMMGVATKNGGCIYVTDMDKIEKSNLNRQFLFRSSDVGKFKSSAAAEAVKRMNPSINVVAYQDKVAPETESVFGDVFFSSLTAVVTALDNVEARLYVDQRCLTYGVPMLESGTLGTKGNTQVVIPKLTENYGASRDPPEKSIPICTLKNFPNQIEHTLQWARDWFEGTFSQNARDVNSYLSNSEQFLDQLAKGQNNRIETLEGIRDSLVSKRPRKFEECISWARLEFEDKFSNQIKQLLHTFPPGTLTSTGTLFWSGTKREPVPLVFNMNDPLHMGFIIASANLRAFNYGLKGSSDPKVFASALKNVMVPEFVLKSGVKIAASDEELEKQKKEQGDSGMQDIESIAKKIITEIPQASTLAGYRMQPADFEKDDDSNFHMDFITFASNLRARNYQISEADKHKSKLIAGRIIPAIATTTALVTGQICVELYKIINEKNKIEDFNNSFVNLALPFFAMSNPIAAKKTKAGTWEWTIWDKVIVDGSKKPLTLQEFLDYFVQKFGVEVNILSYGVVIIYSTFSSAKIRGERLKMTIPALVELVSKKPISSSSSFLELEVCCFDPETQDDVELPAVVYKVR